MKQLRVIMTSILLTGFAATATTTNTIDSNSITTSSLRGYGNSFIFVEEGIEFSIFPDGQFDFYMTNRGPNVSVSINTPHSNISFNSGFDYDAYVQYDEFGAIVQIEHIPVFYDYYGRVNRVGNVFINYNRFGFISQVGGLFVYYNRYNRFSHCSGFINVFNRVYVYRPWHAYYRIPHFNHCVVFNRPYRQYYRPIRHYYSGPYINNYRRTTAVASRRGNTVNRRSELATRGNNTPRNSISSNTVGPRNTAQNNSPRPRVSTKPRTESKPQITGNTPRPRVSAKPRTESKPRVTSNISRPNRQLMKRPTSNTNRVSQKSKSSQTLKYSSSNSKRIALNSRTRR